MSKDPQIHSKTDALTARALKIFMATKGKTLKDSLADALAGREAIPAEIYAIAKKELENESGMAL